MMTEEQIFLAALDLPDADRRSAYLDSVCGPDGDLRRQVESLLAAHFKSGEFLSESLADQLGTSPITQIAETLIVDRQPNEAMVAKPETPADTPDLSFLQPSTRPDSLGRLGHYDMLQVLGHGGFGIVFRAFDEVLQRVVAIKVLAPAIAATSPARKRFLREAQASARVHHENVVQVHAVEELPIPHLVMEFIAGETLQQRLDRTGPLEVAEIVRLARQVAEGLAAAHETGLIHRDIKPGNILIGGGAQEKVKITDFGLARAADDASMTQSGMVAGTPMFMAPEQAQGETLDQRADLFSLGSVMYTMASGRPPFRAATTFAVLKRVVEETPRPIQDIIPETPQWLCDIIERLQEKTPEKRFQTAREVADVLTDCEEQLKEHARVYDLSRIPRVQPQPLSHRKALALATALFLLPLIVLGVSEAIGLTHLFRPQISPQATRDPLNPEITPTPVAATPDAEGWVQLFNRQDLTGWTAPPSAPGQWTVSDGKLIGSRRRSLLFSDRGDFTNFHLRVEAKINLGGDSGVFFRTDFDARLDAEAGPPGGALGYEVEIGKNLAYARKTGSISAPQVNTAPLALATTTDDSLIQPDEWFTLEIIAQENRFISKVNGRVTASYSDPLSRASRGHIALQVWNPNTIVQFRKIEIKELPVARFREFTRDHWIDVVPLIDPQQDKWDNTVTGKNEWRIEQGALLAANTDGKPSKLILPLDSDWQAFECELEFTRTAGGGGFSINLPTSQGECPIIFGLVNYPGIYFGNKKTGAVINSVAELQTGARTKLRIVMRPHEGRDQVAVSLNDVAAGSWTGDFADTAFTYREGYPHDRRLSLFIHNGANYFEFHRIRVRLLDGGKAEALRAALSLPSAPENWGPSCDISYRRYNPTN